MCDLISTPLAAFCDTDHIYPRVTNRTIRGQLAIYPEVSGPGRNKCTRLFANRGARSGNDWFYEIPLPRMSISVGRVHGFPVSTCIIAQG